MRHEAAARKTSRICTKAKAPEAMACFRVAATTLPRGLVHNFHHTFLPCEPQHAATEQTISAKLETIANRSMSRITYLRHTTKMPVRFLCFFFLAASQRRQMPFWQPAAPPRPERARRVLRRGWGYMYVCGLGALECHSSRSLHALANTHYRHGLADADSAPDVQ